MKYNLIRKDTILNEVGPVIAGLGTAAFGTAKMIGDVADTISNSFRQYKHKMESPYKYKKVNKKTGDKEDAEAKVHHHETSKRFGKVRDPMLECIKLISKLTNTSLEESKKIFKTMYKDFVLESSRYLKENTNPSNTLKLFKGYLESEWKKSKKKPSKN